MGNNDPRRREAPTVRKVDILHHNGVVAVPVLSPRGGKDAAGARPPGPGLPPASAWEQDGATCTTRERTWTFFVRTHCVLYFFAKLEVVQVVRLHAKRILGFLTT